MGRSRAVHVQVAPGCGQHRLARASRASLLLTLAIVLVMAAGVGLLCRGQRAGASGPVAQAEGRFLSGRALGVDLGSLVAVNQYSEASPDGSSRGAAGAVDSSGAIAVGGGASYPSSATLDLQGPLLTTALAALVAQQGTVNAVPVAIAGLATATLTDRNGLSSAQSLPDRFTVELASNLVSGPPSRLASTGTSDRDVALIALLIIQSGVLLLLAMTAPLPGQRRRRRHS